MRITSTSEALKISWQTSKRNRPKLPVSRRLLPLHVFAGPLIFTSSLSVALHVQSLMGLWLFVLVKHYLHCVFCLGMDYCTLFSMQSWLPDIQCVVRFYQCHWLPKDNSVHLSFSIKTGFYAPVLVHFNELYTYRTSNYFRERQLVQIIYYGHSILPAVQSLTIAIKWICFVRKIFLYVKHHCQCKLRKPIKQMK